MIIKEYAPASGETLQIWDIESLIKYKDIQISLKYETEPPHGDFIYSVKINMGNTDKDLIFPYWIYGRNILFYNDYIVMEGMESFGGYKNPLHTVIISVTTRQFSVLNEWYCDLKGCDGKIYLKNRFANKIYIFEKAEELIWYPIYL